MAGSRVELRAAMAGAAVARAAAAADGGHAGAVETAGKASGRASSSPTDDGAARAIERDVLAHTKVAWTGLARTHGGVAAPRTSWAGPVTTAVKLRCAWSADGGVLRAGCLPFGVGAAPAGELVAVKGTGRPG
jgi:hypothetical protein